MFFSQEKVKKWTFLQCFSRIFFHNYSVILAHGSGFSISNEYESIRIWIRIRNHAPRIMDCSVLYLQYFTPLSDAD
jgi:hypothetical protein